MAFWPVTKSLKSLEDYQAYNVDSLLVDKTEPSEHILEIRCTLMYVCISEGNTCVPIRPQSFGEVVHIGLIFQVIGIKHSPLRILFIGPNLRRKFSCYNGVPYSLLPLEYILNTLKYSSYGLLFRTLNTLRRIHILRHTFVTNHVMPTERFGSCW